MENNQIFCKDLIIESLPNFLDKERIISLLNNVVCTKILNNSQFLSKLIYEASIKALYPTDDKTKAVDFSPDCVRVCKISGGSLTNSHVINGLMLDGKPEGFVTKKQKSKGKIIWDLILIFPLLVAIYSCPFDFNTTEATSTVLFNNSNDLKKFSSEEEKQVESLVKGIADAGVGVVVSSGKSNEMLLHYANKYDILVAQVNSKWFIRRLCVALNAKPLVTMHVLFLLFFNFTNIFLH